MCIVTIVASGVVVVMIAVARAAGFSTLGYNPFAGLQMPGFTLAEAGLVASVAWPSVFLLGRPALASPPDAPVATAFAEGAP